MGSHRLLGDEVLWFERKPDGYELTAETRLGSLFNGHGAQEALPALYTVRIKLT